MARRVSWHESARVFFYEPTFLIASAGARRNAARARVDVCVLAAGLAFLGLAGPSALSSGARTPRNRSCRLVRVCDRTNASSIKREAGEAPICVKLLGFLPAGS